MLLGLEPALQTLGSSPRAVWTSVKSEDGTVTLGGQNEVTDTTQACGWVALHYVVW